MAHENVQQAQEQSGAKRKFKQVGSTSHTSIGIALLTHDSSGVQRCACLQSSHSSFHPPSSVPHPLPPLSLQILSRVVRMQAVQKTAARLEGMARRTAPAAPPQPSPSALVQRSFSLRYQLADLSHQSQGQGHGLGLGLGQAGSPGRALCVDGGETLPGGYGSPGRRGAQAGSPFREQGGAAYGDEGMFWEGKSRGRGTSSGKSSPGKASPLSQKIRVNDGDDDDDFRE